MVAPRGGGAGASRAGARRGHSAGQAGRRGRAGVSLGSGRVRDPRARVAEQELASLECGVSAGEGSAGGAGKWR